MIKTASLFTNHAVFAANKPIVVFGEGEGYGYVEICGNRAEIKSENGKWIAELAPMDFGGPYELTICMNGETKTLTDIYIGKVYLLFGQSNAEFMLCESNTPKEEYLDDNLFRLIKIKRLFSGADNLMNEEDGWFVANKEGVGCWNALAYLSGKIVRERDNIAVGFVACCQGASVIESWLPKGEADEFGIKPEDKHLDHRYPDFQEFNTDGDLYNRMFTKMIPFKFTKAVWYQGESDTTVPEGSIYEYEVKKFFEIVRKDLKDPELGFVVVQIADFMPRNDDGWKAVQDAQLRLPKIMDGVQTVISADVCENDMIHPVTKSKLAARIGELL